MVNRVSPPPPKNKLSGNIPDKPAKLYLRLPDMSGEKFQKVKNVLELLCGDTTVIFYDEGEKRQYKAPRTMFAEISPVLMNELYYILGKENVVIK